MYMSQYLYLLYLQIPPRLANTYNLSNSVLSIKNKSLIDSQVNSGKQDTREIDMYNNLVKGQKILAKDQRTIDNR